MAIKRLFSFVVTLICCDAKNVEYNATYDEGSQNSILVLSTYKASNRPLIIDMGGNVRNDITFTYGENTVAHNGCGATLFGEFWYFGGGNSNTYTHRRQLSKIVGCDMVRQQDMDFDFYKGSCNSFSEPTPKVLLCFSYYHTKECHTFDGTSFEDVRPSKVSHQDTLGLANYLGNALTTGCYTGGPCAGRTEIFDLKTQRWTDEQDYPYLWSNFGIYQYSTASTSDAAYVIGGGPRWQQTIAQFKNYQWSNFGKLYKGRMNHASITINGRTVVIGGLTDDAKAAETEVWNFDEEREESDIISPKLSGFAYSPGLYAVDLEFCKN